ncbi:uncharacterized protein LOC120118853 [Hibiscus syriacus]|uniref:uncharacterized protein LOC120118853 n=1 Tax=Hibiscus syriacus TaxID=106335 RepID=UPI0019243737|nr:uncharacterized protein LOC120118853 [Hibiscus syriacus]
MVTSPEMINFQEIYHDLHLLDHPFFGLTYSWSNKQKENFLSRKLDRVLINPHWPEYFPHSFVEFLSLGPCDHCMASVPLHKEVQSNRTKPFKFFNCWTLHPNFINIVSHSWSIPIQENPMKKLFLKLKRLNNDYYSDIFSWVRQKREEIEKQQILTLTGIEPVDKELELQNDLASLEEAETMVLKQKEKIHWLKEGEKCTRFFNSVIASKRKKDTIRVIVDDQGRRLETFDDMSSEVVNFFQKLLGTQEPNIKECHSKILKDLIHHILFSKDYEGLTREVTSEEIKEAIFSQGNEKAPGPDGYSPLFFKKTWPVVGKEVIEAITFFFKESYIFPAFNATTIALVPKILNPNKVSDFRPISCCSVIYKAITKIIVTRMTHFLPKIISSNQSAFVKGRSIIDNTLLAQEIVKGYGRKSISPRRALKIDLQKAFDSIH